MVGNHTRVATLTLVIVFIFFITGVCASEYRQRKDITNLKDAITHANDYIGFQYFRAKNVSQLEANQNVWDKKDLISYGTSFGDLINGEYRYVGKTLEGEDFTNIFFTHDAFDTNKKIEDRDWILTPWDSDDEDFRSKYHIKPNPIFNNNPKYLPNIVYGLKTYYKSHFRGDKWLWHQYVHILQPPTYFSWGMGRMWHKTSSGQIWYITVPIAPDNLIKAPLGNLYIKDFNPGTTVKQNEVGESVYEAWTGNTYTATVTFGIKDFESSVDVAQIPIYLAAIHQVDTRAFPASLKFKEGNGRIGTHNPWWFLPFFNTNLQYVSFNAKTAEVTATFQWTAQTKTKELTTAINHPPAFQLHYEGLSGEDYTDNVARKNITVRTPPDFYVKSIKPGTSITEQGKTYSGTVTFGLKNDFHTDFPAELFVEVNGHRVPLENLSNNTVVFRPGEEKTYSFQYIGQNSVDTAIVGRIVPGVDRYWPNNYKKVDVHARKTDIAVESIRQATPIFTNTNQSTEATFTNLGTQKETFVASFYQDKKLKRTEAITLEAGASITRSFVWTAPTKPGVVKLDVVAQLKTDKYLGNNSKNKSVKVVKAQIPASCNPANNKTTGNWDEVYSVVTSITVDPDTGDETYNWSDVHVTYHEELSANIRINTKQGIAVDPSHPKASDRESRGSWEIIPFAQENGLDANKVTRAGYGFDFAVETSYWTSYETKIPTGLTGPANPIGGTKPRPSIVTATFYDTKNNPVSIPITLQAVGEHMVANENGRRITTIWQLPEGLHRLMDGRNVTDRKHYVNLNNPDGEYGIVINVLDAGENHLTVCKEDAVFIYGSMYDDMYTSPKGR